jgi:hypothetical protein
MPLDLLPEGGRRRLDFLPDSIGLILRDGQEWYVARPRVRFVYADTEVGFESSVGIGEPEFDATLDAILKGYEAGETNADFIRLDLALARAMLLRNYDLTTAELARLVWFDYAQDDELLSDFRSIARGDGLTPKAPAGGDTSPPSPPA